MRGRRAVVRGLVAVGGASALAACLDREEPVPRGEPSNRPARQHAWNDRLRRDGDGNPLPPHHHVYRWLDYVGDDLDADRTLLESALTDFERAFRADHDGLLFTVGYGATYFERHGEDVPIPPAEPIVPGENVAIDDADVVVHLASDRPDAVLEAEEALLGDREMANGVEVADAAPLFESQRRRTGFFGAGEPADRRHLNGLPGDSLGENPVPEAAPLFMGFRSQFRRNQATEDRVTIQEGRFAGGTTQHVSGLALSLGSWYDLDEDERIAKLFAPDLSADDVGPVGSALTDHNGVADQTEADLAVAADAGVVGHAQKLASLREDGRPPILRRDVNSDDLGEAGVVFVSLQRSIEDFVEARLAMEGRELAEDGTVGTERDNGILEYVRTRHRGSALLPPRASRSLPT